MGMIVGIDKSMFGMGRIPGMSKSMVYGMGMIKSMVWMVDEQKTKNTVDIFLFFKKIKKSILLYESLFESRYPFEVCTDTERLSRYQSISLGINFQMSR